MNRSGMSGITTQTLIYTKDNILLIQCTGSITEEEIYN